MAINTFPGTETVVERDPSAELKAENARLIALLEANDIQWRAPAEARTASFNVGALTAFHRREGGAVSPVVPRAHGCLPDPLGKQNYGQIRLRAGLRQ